MIRPDKEMDSIVNDVAGAIGRDLKTAKERAKSNSNRAACFTLRNRKFWVPVLSNTPDIDVAYTLARQYLVRVKGFSPSTAELKLDSEQFRGRYAEHVNPGQRERRVYIDGVVYSHDVH